MGNKLTKEEQKAIETFKGSVTKCPPQDGVSCRFFDQPLFTPTMQSFNGHRKGIRGVGNG